MFGIASLLESQGANPYRVRAYRRAAMNLSRLADPAVLFTTPDRELDLPWLGPRLRRKLGELVVEGSMEFHQQLLAELPRIQRELLEVPGVGPRTVRRLVDDLGIRSVRGLARAARTGRLRELRGIGVVRERQLGAAAEALLSSKATSQEGC
jgi:DNA polymerase (family 10)